VTATQPRPDLNEIGPQIGSGTFSAEREDQEIRINLNPNMSDNNVLLIGQVQEGSLAGRWEYSTFTGTRSGGIFRAKPDPG
jgi:hypothetical protein